MKRVLAAAPAVVTALMLASCSAPPEPDPVPTAWALAEKVTADAIYAHLEELSAIATANRGSRSVGTPGYDATVDYIAGALRDKGFEVSTPEFEWLDLDNPGEPTLEVAGRSIPSPRRRRWRGRRAAGCAGSRCDPANRPAARPPTTVTCAAHW